MTREGFFSNISASGTPLFESLLTLEGINGIRIEWTEAGFKGMVRTFDRGERSIFLCYPNGSGPNESLYTSFFHVEDPFSDDFVDHYLKRLNMTGEFRRSTGTTRDVVIRRIKRQMSPTTIDKIKTIFSDLALDLVEGNYR